jgi:hypothetical protein
VVSGVGGWVKFSIWNFQEKMHFRSLLSGQVPDRNGKAIWMASLTIYVLCRNSGERTFNLSTLKAGVHIVHTIFIHASQILIL